MHFYRTLYEGPADVSPSDWSHHATLAEAHAAAKGYTDHASVRIELIDVATDKQGVPDLLRGYSVTDLTPLRTWAITARGGLRETANGT
jgi:hypothetical protein